MAKIAKIKLDRGEPEIMPLESVRKLLAAAQDFKGGILVPYAVLSLFCGIRPEELGKITWKEIDIEAQTVTLGAHIAKMRQKRIVEISDNCLEWLLPHAVKRTPIKGKNWTRNFNKVKEASGYGGEPTNPRPNLKPWTQDIPRHTAISHHLVRGGHEGETARWAGNSPDIIQRYYKGLVKKSEAAEFWSITPASLTGNVLKMEAA